MRRVATVVVSLLLAALTVNADPADVRDRGISPRESSPGQHSRARGIRHATPLTPAEWIRRNSTVLTSTDLVEDDSDLAPLRGWLSGVRVVGLGDGTHGTHEYYTVKKRIINYLAREEGITIVTFEAPWAEFNKLTDYLLTGEGNPRDLLRINGYFFWEYQEMLDLVAWARSYNATRGDKPPIRFVGVDTLPFGSRNDVIAFFEAVDPAYAPTARSKYACPMGAECLLAAHEVRQRLLDNRSRYEIASSAARVTEVLQSARVVEEYLETYLAPNPDEQRDRYMAANLETFLEAQESGTRVFFWGHNEHVGKNFWEVSVDPAENTKTRTAGSFLRERFGDQYYVIGSCFLAGSFTAYERVNNVPRLTVRPMEAPAADNYELLFKEAGSPRLIINLRSAAIPQWLAGPHLLQHGQADFGRTSNGFNVPLRLPEKFDAIVYLDLTTPAIPLP